MNYKEKYHKYLKSEKWAQIKLDLIEIRGQKCERCGAKRQFKYLHLHHLTYDRVFNEEPGDLELLCGGCHRADHGITKKKIKHKKKRCHTKKSIEFKNLKNNLMKEHGGRTVLYYEALQLINRQSSIEKRRRRSGYGYN